MSAAVPTSELDLEGLPLHELGAWLRHTLTELVTALLQRQPPDVKLSLFVLQTVLTAPDAAQNTSAFSQLVDQLIKEPAFPAATWRMGTEREIARLIGTPNFTGVPTSIWELVGVLAWHDLDFQAQLAEQIETEVGRRTLFRVGEFQTKLIAPNTCWLLLALACAHVLQPTTTLGKAGKAARRGLNAVPGLGVVSRLLRPLIRRNRVLSWLRLLSQPLTRRFRRKNPPVDRLSPEERRALELVQAKSAHFGLRPGWAGVWDQWLLLEAYRHWRIAWTVAPVRDALQVLPLHRHRPDHATENIPASAAQISHPAWADQLERWFIEWNRLETTL